MLKITKKLLSYSLHTPLPFPDKTAYHFFAPFEMCADAIVMISHDA
jgi:hypothetical protein